jgi:glycosyltransferase involved in cell wall biosynthesis
MSSPKVAHIIGDMDGFGGTEATLLRYLLASDIPLAQQRVYVLKSLGTGDTLGSQMRAAGVTVCALGQRGLFSPRGALRLWRELRAFRPDVLSGWLYSPSLLACLLAPLLPARVQQVWHIRSLPSGQGWRKPGRMAVQRLLAVLSHLARPALVSNSDAAARAHQAIGFAGAGRWQVIGNGIDAAQYFPDDADRRAVRAELGVPDDAVLVACVGRFVPEKAYPVLFDALAQADVQLAPGLRERLHLMAVGNGVSLDNAAFGALARGALPQQRLHLLGKRGDVARLLRGADLFVLSSVSESFPNALVEAMASALACVTTDAGQCREVLASPAQVVAAGQAAPLAAAIAGLVAQGAAARSAAGLRNRARASEQFVLPAMVAKFDALFRRAASEKT